NRQETRASQQNGESRQTNRDEGHHAAARQREEQARASNEDDEIREDTASISGHVGQGQQQHARHVSRVMADIGRKESSGAKDVVTGEKLKPPARSVVHNRETR